MSYRPLVYSLIVLFAQSNNVFAEPKNAKTKDEISSTDTGGGELLERLDFSFCQTPKLVLDEAIINSEMMVRNFSNFAGATDIYKAAFSYILNVNNPDMKKHLITIDQQRLTLFGFNLAQHLKAAAKSGKLIDTTNSDEVIFNWTNEYVRNVLHPVFSIAAPSRTPAPGGNDMEFLRARKLLLAFLEGQRAVETRIPHYPIMYLHAMSLVSLELVAISEVSLFNHRDACEIIKLKALAYTINNYLSGKSSDVRPDRLQIAWMTYQKRFDAIVEKMKHDGTCPNPLNPTLNPALNP